MYACNVDVFGGYGPRLRHSAEPRNAENMKMKWHYKFVHIFFFLNSKDEKKTKNEKKAFSVFTLVNLEISIENAEGGSGECCVILELQRSRSGIPIDQARII